MLTLLGPADGSQYSRVVRFSIPLFLQGKADETLVQTDQPPQHQADHGKVDPGLAGGTEPLIVAAQPPLE